jgi:hypothetical protein
VLKYILLDNETAIISNREPRTPKEALIVRFVGASNDCQAVIEAKGHQYYREIVDEICEIERDILDGIVKMTIVEYDGRSRPRKWICEELKVSKKHGTVEVCPNDADIYKLISDLRIENKDIRAENALIREELKKLSEKLINIMEGYDLI